MSSFIPILVIWTIPLAPMIYAAIAATVERLTKPVQGKVNRRASAHVRPSVFEARAEDRQPARPTAGDQRAA